jgi:ABC-type multidrug transport system permease subunit
MYIQRPIVEKHARYAFYHPSAEAFSSFISSLPYKIVNVTLTSLIWYFMTNLNRTAGHFFFYLFVGFLACVTMSMFFRTVAALSRSLIQAMVPAGIVIVALVVYSGGSSTLLKPIRLTTLRFRDPCPKHARME